MLKILYFGYLGERAGSREQRIALPAGVTDTAALRQWLARENQALGDELNRPSNRTVVNQAMIVGDVPLRGDEEIAFMPPVSGG